MRAAEQAHAGAVGAAAAAHAAADRAQRQAHRLDCEVWSTRQFIGGDLVPSPTIADAIHGGCELLEAQCKRCNHSEFVDLTLVIWPREKQVHTLKRVLFCRRCEREHGVKLRPDLVALRAREQPDPEPRRASRKVG